MKSGSVETTIYVVYVTRQHQIIFSKITDIVANKANSVAGINISEFELWVNMVYAVHHWADNILSLERLIDWFGDGFKIYE